MRRDRAPLSTFDFRLSTLVPLAAAIATAVALGVGYRFADPTQHRHFSSPPPAPTPSAPLSWPGTTLLTGTLTAYNQRIMSLRTEQGTFAIILSLSTTEVPTCWGYPTLRPGERLVVRAPGRASGSLMAAMVRDARPCPRPW